MDNAQYRKNVMKTLSIGPAKLGLRQVTRKTPRMNVFNAVVGIATETMELAKGLSPYLSGASQLTEPMKINAFEESGDIGYYVTVAAKFLKVKLPGSGKKSKLKGMTRTEAVLQMNGLAGDMLDLAKKFMYGPKMVKTGEKTVTKKSVVLDAIGLKVVESTDAAGKPVYKYQKVTSTVDVMGIDQAATEALFAEREAKIKDLLEQFAPLYWAFVYETFGVPPANVFVGNIAKLSQRYGEGYFELSEAEHRDTDAEIEAMSGAAAAVAA